MISFLISLLIILIVVCVVAAIVQFILSNIGVPAWVSKLVWAVAGLIFLVWLLENLGALGLKV